MELTCTLAMPISGARFTNQIGLALKLLAIGYKPDLILGTSGGCITGVILLLCGVQQVSDKPSYLAFRERVYEMLALLDSSWYLTSWSSNLIASRIIALKEGSIYARGHGEALISRATVDLSEQPEMWIGTKDRTNNVHQLFCTRSEQSSRVQLPGAVYTNGDVQLVTKTAVASCAVPTIVPGIQIQGRTFCDGGISHASPLGPMNKAFTENQVSYHVVYISPVRYNKQDDPCTDELEDDDIWNQLSSSMAGMVRDLHIPDRNNGIRVVGPNATKTVGTGKEALRRALDMQQCSIRSFIELTPHIPEHINFLEMKRGDALRSVQRAVSREDFVVRHWYVR